LPLHKLAPIRASSELGQYAMRNRRPKWLPRRLFEVKKKELHDTYKVGDRKNSKFVSLSQH